MNQLDYGESDDDCKEVCKKEERTVRGPENQAAPHQTSMLKGGLRSALPHS